jgi:hypothetical protein
MPDETRVREVRDAIHRAFGGLPVPQAEQLIATPRTRDTQSEERIRAVLQGKTWQNLAPEFPTEHWASYCYLSPVAYRYYLPALLIGALDRMAERGGLVHSVLFDLRPDFYWLYLTGEDQKFEQRQALFSVAQYKAVCDFLGLHLAEGDRYEHLAAQALRWRWTRIHTASHEATADYYRRLHTYAWPVPDDPEVAELCHEIDTAFADTPYPGDDQLAGIRDDEAAENAMELRGLTWQTVHPELLAQCYTALNFLSDAGFRYYLPAFLFADLHECESNADPVFHLTYRLAEYETPDVPAEELESIVGKERLAFLERVTPPPGVRPVPEVSRFQAFTPPERRAIIRYLEYRSVNSYDEVRIRTALERYWRPSAAVR